MFATAVPYDATIWVRRTAWLALAAAFGLTHWFGSELPIDPTWTGVAIALVAAWQLFRPGNPRVVIAGAGAVAALWALLLQSLGAPGLVVVPLAIAVPAVAAYCSGRNPAFAPPLLREEAMLMLLAVALVVGTQATLWRGWQAALALNVTGQASPAGVLPTSILVVVVGSLAFGALWSAWRRT